MNRRSEGQDPEAALREVAKRAGPRAWELAPALAARAEGEGLLDVAYAEVDSPYGRLMVAVTERGVVRLSLPSYSAEEALSELAREVSPTVTVSIMSQYFPSHRAQRIPLLSRTISVAEYEAVLRSLYEAGLENGWVQEIGAAENYLPDFDREDSPFTLVADTQ